ncbi:AAA family ATPase [Thermovorax subterraneus]|nr:AAA family ATPase [Thermovorax subterraneus]
MGFIKKLKINNFQSHKNTEITFDEGLTVILGPTDQGKSAIIRALKWVLYNEPRGTDFISVGSNLCRVTLEMDDGTVITRERTNNKNRYILIKNGKKQIFEGFGNVVPVEITKAHGIPKIYLDKDSTCTVNLAEQLDGPFLLSENAGVRARVLGRLIGIHIIDAAQRLTINDLSNAEHQSKTIKSEIEEINLKLKEYEDLPLLKQKIDTLQSIVKELREKNLLYKKLTTIKDIFSSCNAEIKTLQATLKKLETVSQAEFLVEKIDFAMKVKTNLIDCKLRLKSIENEINKEQSNIEKTEKLEEASSYHNQAYEFYLRLKKLLAAKEIIVKMDGEISTFKKVLEKTRDLNHTVSLVNQLERSCEKLSELKKAKEMKSKVESQINRLNLELEKFKSIEKLDDFINEASSLNQKLSSLISYKHALNEIETSITKGQAFIMQNNKDLTSLASKYAELLRKLSKCPTCMNSIDDARAEQIAAEILKSGG